MEDEHSKGDAEGGGGTVTTSTDTEHDRTSEGIYTDDEIATASGGTDVRSGGTTSSAGESYGTIVDVSFADPVALTVRAGETVENIRVPAPVDARLDGELRKLYHYLGLDTADESSVVGQSVPVRHTGDGLELGEIGVEPPRSNETPTPTTSQEGGNWLRARASELRFLEAGIAACVSVVLLVPLGVAALVPWIPVEPATSTAVAAQAGLAAVLFARAFLSSY